MITSIYIVIAFVHYWLDEYPMHKHFAEQPEYAKNNPAMITPGKRFRSLERITFYIATANIVACCVMLLLKVFGILEWW